MEWNLSNLQKKRAKDPPSPPPPLHACPVCILMGTRHPVPLGLFCHILGENSPKNHHFDSFAATIFLLQKRESHKMCLRIIKKMSVSTHYDSAYNLQVARMFHAAFFGIFPPPPQKRKSISFRLDYNQCIHQSVGVNIPPP